MCRDDAILGVQCHYRTSRTPGIRDQAVLENDLPADELSRDARRGPGGQIQPLAVLLHDPEVEVESGVVGYEDPCIDIGVRRRAEGPTGRVGQRQREQEGTCRGATADA